MKLYMQPSYDDEYLPDQRRSHGQPYYAQQNSLCCPTGNGFYDTFGKIGPYYCLFVGVIVFLSVFGLLLDQIGKE